MKVKVVFETDTDNDSFYDDKDEFISVLKNTDYVVVIEEIERELRSIVKYQLTEDKTKEEVVELIKNFYYETLPGTLNRIR